MKPIIGILPSILGEADRSYVLHDYLHAIEEAGGMAIMLPYTTDADAVDRFATLCDGFLFTGGVDVDPARYGEARLDTCGETVPMRDAVEFSAFDRLFATEKPILGICRGSQLINVALGGTLYQDIPSQLGSLLVHRQGEPHWKPAHEVCLKKGSPIAHLLGAERIAVNSLHHQSIKGLGEGLEAIAFADDGVIEAAYLPARRYLYLIQWHPERSYDKDENSRRLFAEFISACSGL